MTLKRLISPSDQEEKKRQDFIRGAGLVPSDLKEPKVEELEQEWTRIQLRIKKKALEYIDKELSSKMTGTRTSWILEAIQEKMER